MSAEARARQIVDEAIREATEPLKRAVEELSARVAAVEGSGGPSDTETQKRPARGRTAKAKAQPAEASAEADDGSAGTSSAQAPADEKVPSPRKGNDS